jgi:hypothetical protein
MKRNKLVIITLIITLLLMISGCKKFESIDNPKELTTSPSPAAAITTAPTMTPAAGLSATPAIAPTAVPTVTPIIPTPTPEELSMEAYEKFLKNEMKVSFDRFMPNNYSGDALYKKGNEYTLSEVLDVVTENYFTYSANKKIRYIDYSYIDCGKDGVNELVLPVMILKYRDHTG